MGAGTAWILTRFQALLLSRPVMPGSANLAALMMLSLKGESICNLASRGASIGEVVQKLEQCASASLEWADSNAVRFGTS